MHFEFDEEINMGLLHEEQKNNRARRREIDAYKKKRLHDEISNAYYFKPSIYVSYKDETRVKHGHRSDCQRWMKRETSRRSRNLPFGEILPKGNLYRKYFDYWWTWI